ncbi:MAG: putative transcriptional regulator [Herbinix sp.]|jgi:DNA-binding PadR family transcriptional regulator|nr:putative transcriptional regulator [Herbinix sp.]
MSIEFAILGILSWKPSTGYELKKIFEDSSFMHWSGNNNQIYKALLRLEDDAFVSSELVHQDSGPSKKIYTITEEGLSELKDLSLSLPEAPEIKNSFLLQLAWSNDLSDKEIQDLFFSYEKELKLHLILQQEKKRRSLYSPNRTPRETLIWDAIYENIISTFHNEINWIQETLQKLYGNEIKENVSKMNYQVNEIDNKKYIELNSAVEPLCKEEDALDLIALCWEHETSEIMLHSEALSQDFFNLKTKFAGNFIQKFINYNIKVAAVFPQEMVQKGRFREMALETNKGNHFRMYETKEEAQAWLLK